MSLKNLKANNKVILLSFIILIIALLFSVYPKFDYTVNGAFIFPLFLSFLLLLILILLLFKREKKDFSVSKNASLVIVSLLIFCVALYFLNFYYSLSLIAILNGVLFYKNNYLKIVSHSCLLILAVFLVCKFFLGIELP